MKTLVLVCHRTFHLLSHL